MTRATGRRARVAEPTWFRLLLAGGVLLAVVATVLVVVSEDARWLRLAALAALWSALLGAFAVARSRRESKTAELKQQESKRTYELELQREVSARREYESKVLEHARTEADDRHREELAALREQLDRLTQSLSGLFDGDLLVERLTLSAESTRVRQVGGGDRNRLSGPAPALGHGYPAPQAPVAPPVPPRMPVTAPAPGEDDTVQISLAKIVEYAVATEQGPSDQEAVVEEAAAEEAAVEEAVVDEAVVEEAVIEEAVVEQAVALDEPVVVEEAAVVIDVDTDTEAAPAGDSVVEDLVEPEIDAVEPEIDAVEPEIDAVEPEPAPEAAAVEPAAESVEPEGAAEEPAAPAPQLGDHTQRGEDTVSVSDLLAAYGISAQSRPRRRRAADDD